MGDKIVSETMKPIESMNSENIISKKTKLFGLIGEKAGTNNLFAMINRQIKANSVDAMIIPMNIREDDFYFTVSNMKKSHVDGAYIEEEFQTLVLELLDYKDEIVEVYNRCDFILKEGETLRGFLLEKNDVSSKEELAEIIYKEIIKG
jgi:shikimate 5-dehydrogenase